VFYPLTLLRCNPSHQRGFGLHPGNEASLSSFSADDEISDVVLDNNYSTMSIIDDSAMHDNDVNESHPAEIEAG
jgi:hypothetical protein